MRFDYTRGTKIRSKMSVAVAMHPSYVKSFDPNLINVHIFEVRTSRTF